MPVSLLLCEGMDSSPDVRVLTKLLAGRCRILPHGGKYGMGNRIIARREVIGQDSVFGMLDGDFIEKWTPPVDRPVDWKSADDTVLFGWRWERKEIENYLIDPAVVEFSLGQTLPIQDYQSSLVAARDRLPIYQAARTALATSRLRFRDLPSSFGKARGRERHPFPDNLDEATCQDGLREVVSFHQGSQVVKLDDVQAKFSALLPEFEPGGVRHRSFLHAFSGKDLLWLMDDALRGFGFTGAWTFREKILNCIAQSPDDIGGWLPEWRELQLAIDST
jgi:hypothetical protein